MKRLILVGMVVVAILTAGVVPQTVYADEDEEIDLPPELWLEADEEAYVAQMRQAYSKTRGAIAGLRFYLWKPLVDNKEWQKGFSGAAAAVSGACAPFCNAKAPASMEEVDKVHKQLCELSGEIQKPVDSLKSPVFALGDVLAGFLVINKRLDHLETGIDVAEGMLNSRVKEIAEYRKEVEELVKEVTGELCFIATVAYGTSTAQEIDVLRQFRDEVLLHSPLGKAFVDVYYELSPPIAEFISEHEVVRTVVREGFVDPVVGVVELTQSWWAE